MLCSTHINTIPMNFCYNRIFYVNFDRPSKPIIKHESVYLLWCSRSVVKLASLYSAVSVSLWHCMSTISRLLCYAVHLETGHILGIPRLCKLPVCTGHSIFLVPIIRTNTAQKEHFLSESTQELTRSPYFKGC